MRNILDYEFGIPGELQILLCRGPCALGANHDENEDGMMTGLMLISSSLYVH